MTEKNFKVENFVEIHRKKIDANTICITDKTGLWCRLPYRDHPDGCPNKDNETCRNAPKFDPEPYSHFYLIYADFDFRKYKKSRSELPKWKGKSERMLGNLLYWQGSIKRQLKDYIENIYKMNSRKDIYLLACGSGFNDKRMNQLQDKIFSMEAMGIYVFGTLDKNGIDYELKPKDNIKLVCLLCSKEHLVFKHKNISDYF